MIKPEVIQIDRVQPALGGSASGLEKGIDVVEVATGVNDDRADDNPGYDVDIVEKDEIEVQFV